MRTRRIEPDKRGILSRLWFNVLRQIPSEASSVVTVDNEERRSPRKCLLTVRPEKKVIL